MTWEIIFYHLSPLFNSTNLNSFHTAQKTDSSPYYPQIHGEKAPSPKKLKTPSVKPKKSDILHHFTSLEKEVLNEAFLVDKNREALLHIASKTLPFQYQASAEDNNFLVIYLLRDVLLVQKNLIQIKVEHL